MRCVCPVCPTHIHLLLPLSFAQILQQRETVLYKRCRFTYCMAEVDLFVSWGDLLDILRVLGFTVSACLMLRLLPLAPSLVEYLSQRWRHPSLPLAEQAAVTAAPRGAKKAVEAAPTVVARSPNTALGANFDDLLNNALSEYATEETVLEEALADAQLSTSAQHEHTAAPNTNPCVDGHREKDSSSSGSVQRPPPPVVDAPARAVALKEEGNVLYKQRNFTAALAKYHDAIAVDPTNTTFRLNCTAVFFELGQFEKCLSECDAALDHAHAHNADAKTRAKILTRRASCVQKLKGPAEAVLIFKRALLLWENPDTSAKLAACEKELTAKQQESPSAAKSKASGTSSNGPTAVVDAHEDVLAVALTECAKEEEMFDDAFERAAKVKGMRSSR